MESLAAEDGARSRSRFTLQLSGFVGHAKRIRRRSGEPRSALSVAWTMAQARHYDRYSYLEEAARVAEVEPVSGAVVEGEAKEGR
jgi:hypothetical protein